MRTAIALSCAFALATQGCTVLGMGIGATADYRHNSLEPRNAHHAQGRQVILNIRGRERPVTGQLSATQSKAAMTGRSGRAEVCVDRSCVPEEKAASVERVESTNSGFWIGAGVGAAIDVALVLAVAAICAQGSCAPGEAPGP